MFGCIFVILSVGRYAFVGRGLDLIPFTGQFEILEGYQGRIVREDQLAVIVFARFDVQVVNVVRSLVFEYKGVGEFGRVVAVFIFEDGFLDWVRGA